jgi:RNA polymerase sigma-70 factor, ECF subfamily
MQPPSSPSDADLVEAARAGDHAAFTQLLARHDDRMRRLAYRLVADRSRMERVLQEAYLRAFRELHRSKATRDFENWLFRFTYNACVDELREPGAGPAPSGATGADGAHDEQQTVGVAESVRRALEALPDDQRISVVLIDGERFDLEATAEILGIPQDRVARRLDRARETLRGVLGKELS